MPDPSRAVIYVRISKDRDDETSTTTQESACRKYADMRGWTVAGIEIDRGRSAYKEDVRRPALDRAVKLIQDGAADVLVVWKLDRFVRSVAEFGKLWPKLNKRDGTGFASVTDQFDTTTAMGRAMLQIAVVFAELESAIKGERIDAWHAERLRTGAPPTGPRPFGYRRIDGALEVDPEEARELTAACQAIVAGESLSSIVRDLNDRGIPTAGKRSSWYLPTLRKLLVSPTTGGHRDIDGALLPGSWEPAVEPTLWRQARDILTEPDRRTSPTNQRRHLLTGGTMTCGECGAGFRARTKQTWNQPRYVCLGCGMSVPVAPTDEYVSSVVLDVVDPKSWARARKSAKAPRTDPEALDRELEQLAEEFANSDMTITEWRTMRQAITDRITHARKETVELPDVDDLHAAWPDLSVQAKLLVIDAFCESVTVTRTGHTGPVYRPQERVVVEWSPS